MERLVLIGDCHGKLSDYLRIVERLTTPSIQLGDMGFGFGELRNGTELPTLENHWFLRGNHDCPALARQHPNYLGDFGYRPEWDLFFVSGAQSIDKEWRIEGVSWWDDEELSYAVLLDIVFLLAKYRPRTVVSHDGPVDVFAELLGYREVLRNRTSAALGTALAKYAPSQWVFAHHHRSVRKTIGPTEFICLNELDTCEVAL